LFVTVTTYSVVEVWVVKVYA